jgi:hexosaminidase
MKKIQNVILLLAIFGFFQAIAQTNPATPISIVPKPVSLQAGSGTFQVNDRTPLVYLAGQDEAKHIARFFAGYFQMAGGPVLTAHQEEKGEKKGKSILFEIKTGGKIPAEGYELKVTPEGIVLVGGSGAGLFHGMQTLVQLLPPEICADATLQPGQTWAIPSVVIKDQPRYPYRGMHLDVSRHFFPKEFVKKYIDLIAMYKMNTFQWHLTDDNGWRIEIKKYPKLMETSAWRVDREDLPWGERPPMKPGERADYGGYYTQEQIKEIVEYAKERYVTIIPEIEMPAHSVEVLAAYPALSCTGGPFTVPPGSYWPNSDILCAGNDSVFTFLEDVLTEVIALFPSQYIHIGGDEADKSRWKECPKCQSRIKTEGLKDEKELQSYFIKRIEKFLISKNRKMIGWDEILEGGLAPEATVMSWRGIDGGIAAARQGHDVIMTPTSHCYFDYYQGDPEFEPKGIGGYVSLKKVYSFEPTPAELNAKEAKHILGAQGNVWTEFIATPEHAEYMAVPRMIALAEVTWSKKEQRNWPDFQKRMKSQFKRLDYMKVNYSRGSFKVSVNTVFDKKENQLKVLLESEQGDLPISYSLDGNDPTLKSPIYQAPIPVTKNAFLKAGIFVDGKLKQKFSESAILIHKATGKPVKYFKPYSYRYPAGGDDALTNGLRGTVNHRDGSWQGFLGNDMEVVIDLGKVDTIMSAAATFLQNSNSWIFMPDTVIFSLSSDGKRFHSINEVANDIPQKTDRPVIKQFSQGFPKTVARYIKVRAKNVGVCPPWHDGKGEACWMFVDEIVVY